VSFLSVEDGTSSKKVLCERLGADEHVCAREMQTVCMKMVTSSSVARPKCLVEKYFHFNQATVFCSGQCLSKHKMTRYARYLEGAWLPWLRLWLQEKNDKEIIVYT